MDKKDQKLTLSLLDARYSRKGSVFNLSSFNNSFIVGTTEDWVVKGPVETRKALGLGTLALQNEDSVNIIFRSKIISPGNQLLNLSNAHFFSITTTEDGTWTSVNGNKGHIVFLYIDNSDGNTITFGNGFSNIDSISDIGIFSKILYYDEDYSVWREINNSNNNSSDYSLESITYDFLDFNYYDLPDHNEFIKHKDFNFYRGSRYNFECISEFNYH